MNIGPKPTLLPSILALGVGLIIPEAPVFVAGIKLVAGSDDGKEGSIPKELRN
jgi:hypothetical protein